MSSDYEPGHGLTETDEANAMLYAQMRQNQAICRTDPVNWVWKADPVVGYPCPEGLDCPSGHCEFTKPGCQAYSNNPYFDCKRKTVPCGFGDGTCQVCDWTLVPSEGGGIPCPQLGDPKLTDEDAKALGDDAVYCRPGDLKVVPTGTYVATPKPDSCRPQQSFACKGLPDDRTPYLIDGQKVSCKCDDDCSLIGGLAGTCAIETPTGPQALPATSTCQDTPAQPAYCYPPDRPYTEWRENFSAIRDQPGEDTCVVTFNNARIWCEMPWTRPTGVASDGISADPACWKSQYKEPFYYHEEDGKCYVTKSYCENEIGQGGFDGSYGDGKDYFLLSSCTTPQGDTNEIQPGYDCCTTLGASIAQFFFGGQVVTASWDNLWSDYGNVFQGKTSPMSYCSNTDVSSGNPLESLVSFLSDERLKTNIQLVDEDGVGLGISVYTYEWTPEAKRLYHKPDGVVEGVLMNEIEKVFPQHIRMSQYGHKVFAHIPSIMPKTPDVKALVYVSLMVYLIGSSDVIDPPSSTAE